MQNEQNGEAEREASLVKLYMDLTGTSESAGRSVFMYLGCGKAGNDGLALEESGNSSETKAPVEPKGTSKQADVDRRFEKSGPSSVKAGTNGD